MIVLKLVWKLLNRLFLGTIAFAAILLLGYCAIKPVSPRNASDCEYQLEAEFNVAGHRVLIPARKGTHVEFSSLPGSSSLKEYINVDTSAPWNDDVLGFCKKDLAGQTDAKLIWLENQALANVPDRLGLPSSDTIDRLTFGTTGVGGWLVPPPVNDGHETPHLMLLSEKGFDVPYWHFLATAGWLETGHRISSWCVAIPDQPTRHCNVRVTRRSDGMVFEAWNIAVKDIPQANAPPPNDFLVLAERLPGLVDLYSIPSKN